MNDEQAQPAERRPRRDHGGRVCPLADIDYLVTGDGADPAAAEKIRAAGVEVVCV